MTEIEQFAKDEAALRFARRPEVEAQMVGMSRREERENRVRDFVAGAMWMAAEVVRLRAELARRRRTTDLLALRYIELRDRHAAMVREMHARELHHFEVEQELARVGHDG